MSFVLASATLSRLVLAHDCVDANPDALSDASAANSESEITVGLRWFYCAGLGVALATLGKPWSLPYTPPSLFFSTLLTFHSRLVKA